MDTFQGPWALILGSSSGFGGAAAVELARNGYGIFGVHFDRRDTMPNADRIQDDIRKAGTEALFFNMNAGDDDTITHVTNAMLDHLRLEGPAQREDMPDPPPVRVVLHSIAFGSLKDFFAESSRDAMSQRGMEMSLHLMAHSLVYWTQALVRAKLLGRGSRIFALTSAGGRKVWHTYGAVSAAKAAIESHIRQIALELAPFGITANAIQAGVTDTPALRKIPGHEHMIEYARRLNPHHRLTTPEDVARAMICLADERTQWMTGNTIRVDGGEDIVG